MISIIATATIRPYSTNDILLRVWSIQSYHSMCLQAETRWSQSWRSLHIREMRNKVNLTDPHVFKFETQCGTYTITLVDDLVGIVSIVSCQLTPPPPNDVLLPTRWYFRKMSGMSAQNVVKFCRPDHARCHDMSWSANMSAVSFRHKEKYQYLAENRVILAYFGVRKSQKWCKMH